MKTAIPRSLYPRWDTLVLVCKACRKRSGAPEDVKPKQLAHEVRRVAHDADRKPRVVLTDCLGLCPKQAIAVVYATGEGNAVYAVDAIAQVALLAPPLQMTQRP